VAGFEFIHIEVGNRNAYMLLFATRIGKAKVNEFNFVFFHHLQYISRGL
jgi:hypothetical protein